MKITKEQLRGLIRKELKEAYRRQGVGGWSREGYETGREPRWDQFDDDRPGTQYANWAYRFKILKVDEENPEGIEKVRVVDFRTGPEYGDNPEFDSLKDAELQGEKYEEEMRKKYGDKFIESLGVKFTGIIEI
jgi:hypothetical protein